MIDRSTSSCRIKFRHQKIVVKFVRFIKNITHYKAIVIYKPCSVTDSGALCIFVYETCH